MSIEVLFYTQLGSIIVFVGSLFVLYRVLVSQKDATIESLREKNSLLEHKLAEAAQSKPDALARSLSERVNHLNQEIERLSKDKDANRDLIAEKEQELESVKEETEELSQQIKAAHELMGEFFCPHCKAPMAEREIHSELVEYEGRELDVDHEYIAYECGLSMIDGKISRPCRNA